MSFEQYIEAQKPEPNKPEEILEPAVILTTERAKKILFEHAQQFDNRSDVTYRAKIQVGSKVASLQFKNGRVVETLYNLDALKDQPENFKALENVIDQPKIPGETTLLYTQIFEIIQSFCDTTQNPYRHFFTTTNEKMRAWMMNKAQELGYEVTNDSTEHFEAQKMFYPNKKI